MINVTLIYSFKELFSLFHETLILVLCAKSGVRVEVLQRRQI